MMSSSVAIMLTAFKAMAKIFFIVSAGIIGSYYNILPPACLSLMANLSTNLLLPCLIVSSLGAVISTDSLQRLSIMLLFSLLDNSISYLIMNIIGRYIMGSNDKELFPIMTVAVSSPNCIALPLLVCSTLCEQNSINFDYQSNSDTCFNDAKAMIFVYAISWHMLYWSLGMSRLSHLQTINDDASFNYNPIVIFNNFTWSATFKFAQIVFLTPTILATLLGISIGLIEPLKIGLFLNSSSFLSPLGGALKALGDPVVTLNCLINAGSLASVKIKLNYHDLGQITNLFRKKISIAKDIEENNTATYEVVNVIHDIKPQAQMTEQVKDKTQDKSIEQQAVTNPSFRTVLCFLACRLILPVTAIIPILSAFRELEIIPKEQKLMFLVICIISSSPSAQMVVVCLNQLGFAEAAGKMSYLYLFQYSFSIITITAVATIAMNIFY